MVVKTYEDGSELKAEHLAIAVVGAAVYCTVVTVGVCWWSERPSKETRRIRKAAKRAMKNVEYEDFDA